MRLPPSARKLLNAIGVGIHNSTVELGAMRADLHELISATRDEGERDRQQERERQSEKSDIANRILAAERDIQEHKQREDRPYKYLGLWIQLFLAAATALAFIAAFIYAGFAYGQWQTMNRTYDEIQKQTTAAQSASIAASQSAGIAADALKKNSEQFNKSFALSRESLVSVQRAFVSFSGQGSYAKIPFGKKTGALLLTLPWINSGTTPTRKGDSQVNWRAFPEGLPKDFDFRDEAPTEHVQFVVAPKAYANGTLTIPIFWIGEARNKKTHLFVWGWITYHDIFSGTPTRLSEFCNELTNVTSTTDDIADPSSTISSEFTLCREHNCTDEECRDYKQKTKGK